MTAEPTTASTTSALEGPEPDSYADAEQELETILEALEADDVDVDELSSRVARARELITWCRGRLRTAEVTITELLADPDD
ncbi:MAG: exodeoxyribonuclease VII small subunit [Actinomycetota bacterium]